MRETSSESITEELELWGAAQSQQQKPQQLDVTRSSVGQEWKGVLQRNKTHCKHGHEFTPENTYRFSGGGRACKACAIKRALAHQLKPESKLKKSLKAKLDRITCPEKEKARIQRYRLKHPERIKQLAKIRRKKHLLKLREALQKYRKTHAESVKTNRLRWYHATKHVLIARRYKMSPKKYQQMLAEQNNRCAICDKDMKRPHLDHNHATGNVRAFLCPGCNLLVGIIEKRGNGVIKAAQEYVLKHL